MKKSTLLSLATAGAIVATSVGTFATWDTLSSTTAPVTVEYGQSVVTTATLGDVNNVKLAGTGSINGASTAEVKFKVKVDGLPTTGTNTLKFGLVDSGENDLTPTGFTVQYYESSDTERANALTTKSITTGAETEYVAVITVDNADGARPADTATLTDSFKVKATLDHTPAAE